jgi:hypothetical protein
MFFCFLLLLTICLYGSFSDVYTKFYYCCMLRPFFGTTTMTMVSLYIQTSISLPFRNFNCLVFAYMRLKLLSKS